MVSWSLSLLVMSAPRLRAPGAELVEAGRSRASLARPQLNQVPAAQRCFSGARFPLACCRFQTDEHFVGGIVDLADNALHPAGVDPGEALTRLIPFGLAGNDRLNAPDLLHQGP